MSNDSENKQAKREQMIKEGALQPKNDPPSNPPTAQAVDPNAGETTSQSSSDGDKAEK